jgi:hypothetical protein
MSRLAIALFVLFFPLSLAVLPILSGARRLGVAAETDCFSKPNVECAGCPDFDYVFRRRGIPPLLYVEDALLFCGDTGSKASISQGRLRKALARMKAAEAG